MRNTWSKQLSEKPWGRIIRCSIKLRKELGREPTWKEVNEGLDTDDKYSDITAKDISRAFMYGEEVCKR
jgi:DNA-directed RNA polymerase specialized sigma subunit